MRQSIVLATLALTGCSLPLAGTVEASSFPAGEVKVDMGCFSSQEDDSGWGSQWSRPRPASAPAAPMGGAPSPKGSASRRLSKPRAGGASKPSPAMAPAMDMAPAMEEAEAAPMPMAPPPPAKREEAQKDSPSEWARSSRPQRNFDWGGETWLSNDDSMSLASAQRLLWAVDNQRGFSASEIRPHEVLNYFSFDTEKPEGSGTFEVTASAERDGDSLSVALAVQGAKPTRQALDLTMVIDRSCSMREEGRMDYTKRGLRKMTDQLARGDRLDLVLFDDKVCTPLENFVVGRDDPKLLDKVIRAMTPDGGTNMDRGLKAGYEVASRKQGTHRRNRRVMVLTDAMLNTGDVNPNTVSEIGRKVESEGIRLTGIGVGRTFNDDVLNKLTEKGKGAYVYLGSEAVVDRVFGSGFDALVQTIAHDVRFKLDLPDSLALERFYGEEASTTKSDIQPIHYYAGTSQVFLQDLQIHDKGLVMSDPVSLHVEWRDALTGEPEKRVFKTTVGDMLEADPHNVRKARTLMAFTDVLSAKAMGGDPCGRELSEYRSRANGVGSDAEVAYVSGLLQKTCPRSDWSSEPRSVARVDLKVKVDSDIPIAEVVAECSERHAEGLSPADTVARFEVSPGQCDLTLHGAVPMRTQISVAETGSDVRCLVRGGRISCS